MANIREKQRSMRISQMRTWIETAQKKKGGVDVERLICTACVEFGVTRRTAKEYFVVLLNSGRVKL